MERTDSDADISQGGDGGPVIPGPEPGLWLAWSGHAEVELLDPRHTAFRSEVEVIGSGARANGDRLDDGYEMLCRRGDVIYLVRQCDDNGWFVAHVQRDVDECPGVDEVMEGSADPWGLEQLEGFLQVAETELFPPSEYFEWIEGGGSMWDHSEWSQEIVDGKAMWVPCARYFLEDFEPELEAIEVNSGYGPMTSVFIEEVFEYGGYRFVVTGDPEGGDLDVDVYRDDLEQLPEDWVHPLSMMVDVNGLAVSIAYDEDEAPRFEDSLSDGDHDEIGESELHETRISARQLLANLRVVHNGVEIVGPNASPVLPSDRAWLAFPTEASLTELDTKVGRVFVADVSGRTMAFTDNMQLAVAARLSNLEPIIRITHKTVEIADPSHEAIVARESRLGRFQSDMVAIASGELLSAYDDDRDRLSAGDDLGDWDDDVGDVDTESTIEQPASPPAWEQEWKDPSACGHRQSAGHNAHASQVEAARREIATQAPEAEGGSVCEFARGVFLFENEAGRRALLANHDPDRVHLAAQTGAEAWWTARRGLLFVGDVEFAVLELDASATHEEARAAAIDENRFCWPAGPDERSENPYLEGFVSDRINLIEWCRTNERRLVVDPFAHRWLPNISDALYPIGSVELASELSGRDRMWLAIRDDVSPPPGAREAAITALSQGSLLAMLSTHRPFKYGVIVIYELHADRMVRPLVRFFRGSTLDARELRSIPIEEL